MYDGMVPEAALYPEKKLFLLNYCIKYALNKKKIVLFILAVLIVMDRSFYFNYLLVFWW